MHFTWGMAGLSGLGARVDASIPANLCRPAPRRRPSRSARNRGSPHQAWNDVHFGANAARRSPPPSEGGAVGRRQPLLSSTCRLRGWQRPIAIAGTRRRRGRGRSDCRDGSRLAFEGCLTASSRWSQSPAVVQSSLPVRFTESVRGTYQGLFDQGDVAYHRWANRDGARRPSPMRPYTVGGDLGACSRPCWPSGGRSRPTTGAQHLHVQLGVRKQRYSPMTPRRNSRFQAAIATAAGGMAVLLCTSEAGVRSLVAPGQRRARRSRDLPLRQGRPRRSTPWGQVKSRPFRPRRELRASGETPRPVEPPEGLGAADSAGASGSHSSLLRDCRTRK